MVLIGFGNIGHALYKYRSFRDLGYEFKAVFDKQPELVEDTTSDEVEIYNVDKLEDYLKDNQIDIGIIATPKEAAQDITDILCEGGVKGIWNFSPVDLKVKNNVVIESVHLDESLFTLTYFMNSPEDFIF